MELGSTFQAIANGWPSFHALQHDDKQHPIRRLVTDTAPLAVEEAIFDKRELKVEGSVGKGNLTAAPWIAVFHDAVTTTAQEEYYIVYLFSLDMSQVILELGLGATQFERAFRTNNKALAPLRAAAGTEDPGTSPAHFSASIPEEMASRISLGPADLATQDHRFGRHKAYEQGSIFHVAYSFASLPWDEVLRSDLNRFVSLYRRMAEDPLIPTVRDLAWSEAPSPEVDDILTE